MPEENTTDDERSDGQAMRIAREVFNTPVTDEIKDSFLAYALSVITSRAIPDVRDGLKPVQRRILYTLNEQGLRPGTPYKKSARVVGETMGKYHPHGDSAIYDALVRLAQDFAMRVPLVDGHGNFGSLTDPAAASRYCVTGDTRLRLADGRTVRIDSLAKARPNSDVDIDIKVLDRFANPTATTKFFHSGSHPVKKVVTREGYTVTGTGNHPLLCLVTQDDGRPELAWRLIDEIGAGDVVVVDRARTDNVGGSEYDRKLGLLAGALIAEGWMGNSRCGFNNVDKDYFDLVLNAYDDVVGGRRYVYSRTIKSGSMLWELDVQKIDSIRESPIAELLGNDSYAKRVPEFVWQGSPELKRAFLQSVFEGDGSCSLGARTTIGISYSTRSVELARDLQMLLLEFGVVAKHYTHASAEHTLSISNRRDARLFAKYVGFLCTKQARLTGFLEQVPLTSSAMGADHVPYFAMYARRVAPRGGREWLSHRNIDRIERWERDGDIIESKLRSPDLIGLARSFVEPGYYYATVRDVVPAGDQPVYSIRVDDDEHAFIANGFVNHNTECRMAAATVEVIGEIREDTVDFRPNYDGQETEPEVLPAGIPNLVVNGVTGIAVGMATNIPPHNLGETVEACKMLLRKPDSTLDDLLTVVSGPDFPTGGVIVDDGGVRAAYETGRGAFKIRAKAIVGDVSPRRRGITITELPYNVSPERFIERCKQLINNKQLEGIADIKDLTDGRHGMRVIVECKTGVNPTGLLGELYAKTPLEESFSVNAVALVKGKPLTLGLKAMLVYYLEHRMEVIVRRTQFRLDRDEARAHLLEGILLALTNIDEVVSIIRKSKDTEMARERLMRKFKLDETQTNYILEMPLRRLTSLEVAKVKDELKQLRAAIVDYRDILTNEPRRKTMIGDELSDATDALGTARCSRIIDADKAAIGQVELEVADEPCVVTLSSTGVVGRLNDTFKGKLGNHDGVVAATVTTTRAVLKAVTDRGRMLTVEAVEVPAVAGRNRGAPAVEIFDLDKGEKVVGLFGPTDIGVTAGKTICLVTKAGVIKRVMADQLETKSGATYIGLKDVDTVVAAFAVTDGANVAVVASDAQLLNLAIDTVRPQGRSAGGVAGMRLSEDAYVLAAGVCDTDAVVTTTSDGGAAKRTPAVEYPVKGRGTGGVRCQRFRREESILTAAYVGPEPVIGLDSSGKIIELPAGDAKRDAAGDYVEEVVVVLAQARSGIAITA